MMAEKLADIRPYLFTVAYNMLGSVMDAEDIVQEAYLRWQRIDQTVDSPKAFLTTLVTRLCIDHLRSAKSRRETYIGLWLPKPLVSPVGSPSPYPDAEEIISLSESLSMAFLILPESLSPTERAVFLLRQIFEYDYIDIAAIVNKSEANCRQLLRRARQRIEAGKPRFDVPFRQQETLVTQFAETCLTGDLDGLMHLLAEDIEVWSDGGGKVRTAHNVSHGQEKVARFLLGVMRFIPDEAETQFALINGQLGIVATVNERPLLVIALEMWSGRIQAIRSVLNPDKLQHL
jgi:RNA polymerase sigma-70 factor (ECF subfamily)